MRIINLLMAISALCVVQSATFVQSTALKTTAFPMINTRHLHEHGNKHTDKEEDEEIVYVKSIMPGSGLEHSHNITVNASFTVGDLKKELTIEFKLVDAGEFKLRLTCFSLSWCASVRLCMCLSGVCLFSRASMPIVE